MWKINKSINEKFDNVYLVPQRVWVTYISFDHECGNTLSILFLSDVFYKLTVIVMYSQLHFSAQFVFHIVMSSVSATILSLSLCNIFKTRKKLLTTPKPSKYGVDLFYNFILTRNTKNVTGIFSKHNLRAFYKIIHTSSSTLVLLMYALGSTEGEKYFSQIKFGCLWPHSCRSNIMVTCKQN